MQVSPEQNLSETNTRDLFTLANTSTTYKNSQSRNGTTMCTRLGVQVVRKKAKNESFLSPIKNYFCTNNVMLLPDYLDIPTVAGKKLWHTKIAHPQL
jgi:hypothetical protein